MSLPVAKVEVLQKTLVVKGMEELSLFTEFTFGVFGSPSLLRKCPFKLCSSLVFKCLKCGLKNQVRSVHFEVRVATVGLKVVEISATQPRSYYCSSAASGDVASLSASRHTRAKTAST